MISLAKAVGKQLTLTGIVVLLVMIGSVLFILTKTLKLLQVLRESAEEVAKGDLSVQMPVASKDEIGELASAFNRMVESMRSIISVINHSAENVTEAAEHLRAVSEETNASSEQITVAINEVAAGATRSAEESSDAAEQSHRLGEQIAVISSGADRLTKTARQTEEAQEEGIRQIQALGTSSAETSLYIEEAEKVILALETKITSIERIMQTITDISS
ncbi:methyl-accepting chemotaxis protein [Bacillus thermotolerans]|nr:methyl-accepting chemotaxis protein [Bacillus thermotolerans]KKB44143.1 methyl-accepting chemotaxis protein [Bacillus thermotolerans]